MKNNPLSWWAHLGSNQGPTGYEPVALPAELWAHPYYRLSLQGVNPMHHIGFRVMFQENSSVSWPGWDVAVSLAPLLRSVEFFPG
jgi:hypothetical protein